MKFSNDAENLLAKAGWHEGRAVNVSSIEESLIARGYSIAPVVHEFLQEFGGLRLKFPYDRNKGTMGLMSFNAGDAGKGLTEKVKAAYERAVGAPLCVIGMESQDLLMMDTQGKVYSAFEQYLELIGESGMDAIENILRGKNIRYTRMAP
jgi:hypothetical protein